MDDAKPGIGEGKATQPPAPKVILEVTPSPGGPDRGRILSDVRFGMTRPTVFREALAGIRGWTADEAEWRDFEFPRDMAKFSLKVELISPLRVEVTWSHKGLGCDARLLNSLARVFVSRPPGQANEQAKKDIEYLASKLAEAKGRLETAGEEFKKLKNGSVPKSLTEDERRLEKVKADYRDAELREKGVKDMIEKLAANKRASELYVEMRKLMEKVDNSDPRPGAKDLRWGRDGAALTVQRYAEELRGAESEATRATGEGTRAKYRVLEYAREEAKRAE